MGNPDGATPQVVVDKLIEAARNPRNHRYSHVARHPAPARGDRQALQAQARRRSRSRHGSDRHHGRERRAGASAVCDDRARRCGGLAEPRLSDSPVRRDHVAKGTRTCCPCRTRTTFLERLRRVVPGIAQAAEDAADFVPAQPHHHVRGSGVSDGNRGTGAAARHADRSRFRLCRSRLRRLHAAQHSAGAGRERCRGRDLLHVEELRHGGLARGLSASATRR